MLITWPLVLAAVEMPSEVAFDVAIAGRRHSIVEFHAPWCEACKTFAPLLNAAIADIQRARGDVHALRVDGDSQLGLRTRYNVREAPAVLLLPSGSSPSIKPVAYSGPLDQEALHTWLLRELSRLPLGTQEPSSTRQSSGKRPRPRPEAPLSPPGAAKAPQPPASPSVMPPADPGSSRVREAASQLLRALEDAAPASEKRPGAQREVDRQLLKLLRQRMELERRDETAYSRVAVDEYGATMQNPSNGAAPPAVRVPDAQGLADAQALLFGTQEEVDARSNEINARKRAASAASSSAAGQPGAPQGRDSKSKSDATARKAKPPSPPPRQPKAPSSKPQTKTPETDVAGGLEAHLDALLGAEGDFNLDRLDEYFADPPPPSPSQSRLPEAAPRGPPPPLHPSPRPPTPKIDDAELELLFSDDPPPPPEPSAKPAPSVSSVPTTDAGGRKARDGSQAARSLEQELDDLLGPEELPNGVGGDPGALLRDPSFLPPDPPPPTPEATTPSTRKVKGRTQEKQPRKRKEGSGTPPPARRARAAKDTGEVHGDDDDWYSD